MVKNASGRRPLFVGADRKAAADDAGEISVEAAVVDSFLHNPGEVNEISGIGGAASVFRDLQDPRGHVS
jgi:hypothetical protein